MRQAVDSRKFLASGSRGLWTAAIFTLILLVIQDPGFGFLMAGVLAAHGAGLGKYAGTHAGVLAVVYWAVSGSTAAPCTRGPSQSKEKNTWTRL